MQYKEANNFYHPISAKLNDGYDIEDEHSFQVQIGSKIMPEYPLSSVTEALYQLGKPLVIPFIFMVGGSVLVDILLEGMQKRFQVLVLLASRRNQEIKLRLISKIAMLKVGQVVFLLGCIVLSIMIVFLIFKTLAFKC